MELLTIKSVLNNIHLSLLGQPEVVGVGYGLKETYGRITQEFAWRVYVRKKKPQTEIPTSRVIPKIVEGICTDVIEHSPSLSTSGNIGMRPNLGVKIANSKGITGTLGCIVHTMHDNQPALLSNWHILYGNDTSEDGDVIWWVDETSNPHRYNRIGENLYGKIGNVQFDGETYYIDCAVGSYLTPLEKQTNAAWTLINGYESAQPGELVTKNGAATGCTSGIVIDTQYSDFSFSTGHPHSTPRQILVKPINGVDSFSTEGDSGAAIINSKGNAVGLLWGTNSRGEGVACPIEPVLYAMNIDLGLFRGL